MQMYAHLRSPDFAIRSIFIGLSLAFAAIGLALFLFDHDVLGSIFAGGALSPPVTIAVVQIVDPLPKYLSVNHTDRVGRIFGCVVVGMALTVLGLMVSVLG